MTKEFSSIMELKVIREQKSRLSEREQELSSPILTDLSLIPDIYSWFNDIVAETDDVSFIYQQYKNFRQDIESIYRRIMEKVQAKEYIK